MRDFLHPKNNAIGFVRLALASMVLFGHGCELAAYHVDAHRWGVLAVLGFFTLSGMLVAQSFETCKSPWDFAWRRALRIYPGLWANLLFTAFLLIPLLWLFLHGSLAGYFAPDASPQHYVWINAPILRGMEGDIRHVFAHNPFPVFVNGSLWTLSIEVICYIVLGFAMAFGMMKRARIVAPILAILATAFFLWNPHLHVPRAIQKLFFPEVVELYAAFAIGMSFYAYRERMRLIPWLGWACTLFSAVILWNRLGVVGDAVRPFTTAYAALWLAAAIPLRGFDKNVDLSYGVYIYAFPVTQCAVLLGLASSPVLYFTVIVALVALLSYASWMLVESRALKYKKLLADDWKNPRRLGYYSYVQELRKQLRGCASCLEVGCGPDSPGRRVPLERYVGVDGYEPAIAQARLSDPNGEYLVARAEDVGARFPAKEFDAVIALDLIEHLNKDDGLALIGAMERLARREVILFTPNGFLPQESHDGDLQEHLSGWTAQEMQALGFRVIGMYGPKALRGEQHRTKIKPAALGGAISQTLQLWTRWHPAKAAALMCVKELPVMATNPTCERIPLSVETCE